MRRSATGLVLLGVLMTAGCTAGPVEGLDVEPTVEPDWVVEGQMIGSPSAVDGMVTSYLLDDKDLSIAVWDEETGEELWREPASTGAGTPGVTRSAQAFSHDGTSYVTYLRPEAGSNWHHLVVADMSTGEEERIANSLIHATHPPSQCEEGEAAVCVPGFLDGTTDFEVLRYQIGAERVTPVNGATDGVRMYGYRMLGEHIFSTFGRGTDGQEPEQLGYLDDEHELAWSRSYAEVFGEGYSSDGLWSWADGDSTTLAIGAGRYWDPGWFEDGGGAAVVDLTERRIVALDRSSGNTIWTMDGGLGCPFFGLDVAGPDDEEVLVACRYNAGKISSAEGDVKDPEAPDMDLVGVDPLTGDEIWTVPLGERQDEDDDVWFAGGGDQLILKIAGETVSVDLATGETEQVPDGTYLCGQWRDFEAPNPGELGATLEFNGGAAKFPCDQTGAELETRTLSLAALTLAGGDQGESVLVSGTDSWRATRCPMTSPGPTGCATSGDVTGPTGRHGIR